MKKITFLLVLFIIAYAAILTFSNCTAQPSQSIEATTHQHQWTAATCTEPQTCSVCKITYGSALGHTTSTGVCTRCNKRTGWTKSEVQKIIQIRSVYVDDIDSVGGVDMIIQWKNTSSKTIKYIRFTAEPYNAVGDRVPCKIRGYDNFVGKCTGPFEPEYTSWWYWEYDNTYNGGSLWSNCWYNNTVKKIRITQINIEYMDGTTEIISNEYTDYAFYS